MENINMAIIYINGEIFIYPEQLYNTEEIELNKITRLNQHTSQNLSCTFAVHAVLCAHLHGSTGICSQNMQNRLSRRLCYTKNGQTFWGVLFHEELLDYSLKFPSCVLHKGRQNLIDNRSGVLF